MIVNIPRVKIGIVAGSTEWMPSDLAERRRNKLKEECAALYEEDDLYECSVLITDNEISVKRALRELNKAECDAVCLYYANYGPETAGAVFIEEFDGPVMMCGAAEEGERLGETERADALSGFINACYGLWLRGKRAFIPQKPIGTYDECAQMIHRFLPVARTLIAVRRLKIIQIGPRPSSYLASSAPTHMFHTMGVDISEFSEMELYNSFVSHADDSRIEKIVEEMREEVKDSVAGEHDMLYSYAQYELTLKDWVRAHKGNRDFVALTGTCWPAFPISYGFVPCYVHGRLTAQGMPVACEVDAYGALSEYIGQCVSEEDVTLLNINNNIPRELYEKKIAGNIREQYEISDLFLGYHCGVTSAHRLINARRSSHFVNRQLIGEEMSHGTVQGQLSPTNITLFRIQGGIDGVLRAYVKEGEILPVETDTYGGMGVIAVKGMEEFIRDVVIERHFPNHTAVLFGHYGDMLVAVLKQLGVLEIYK